MAMATPPGRWSMVITMTRRSVTVIRHRPLYQFREEEEDEEGEVINEEEIEAAQAENIRLANSWLCAKRNVKKGGRRL